MIHKEIPRGLLKSTKVRGQKGQAVIFYSHNLDGQSGQLKGNGLGMGRVCGYGNVFQEPAQL